MNPRFFGILFICAGVLPISQAATKGGDAHSIDYNKDIRPILAENCFSCHGPDSAARKGNLRLDRFDDAILPRKESHPAIVPGKPDDSEVVHRIFATDDDDRMPPVKTKRTLDSRQKEALKQWIASGAKYQAHWSFIPPVKSEVPEVKNKEWVQNPIDAFILARLENEGLQPAPEADRATLVRRVSLDLTGLPPSPELVQEFENDPSPDAYEKLVDRLLASEHYGEHRARYWLDGARYADSNGIHFDNYREIWSYREWVINAFNDNMHFDEFTLEQLAGDLLPKPSLEQKIATGFNRCNITTSEGGAIDEEYLVLYARDRTEATSAVWMGLTTGCAVCHDHKFDPISQKEFYQLSAYFNNTTQPAMDGNKKDTPPVIVVPTHADRSRWDELPPLKKSAKARVESRRQGALDDFTSWLAKATPESFLKDLPSDGLQFSAPLKEPVQPTITVFVNGYAKTLPLGPAQEGVISAHAFTTSKANVPVLPEVGDFEKDQSFSAGLWVYLTDDKDGSIISRMDEDDGFRGWDIFLEGGKPAVHMVHKWPDDALKIAAKKPLEMKKWTHVFFSYDGSGKPDGLALYIDGQRQDVDRPADKLQNTIRSKAPFKIGQRKNGENVERAGVQDVRVYGRVLNREEILVLENQPRLAWLVSKGADKRSEDEQKALYDGFLNGYDHEFIAAAKALATLEDEERAIKLRGTVAHIMNEKSGEASAYVLFRGEYDKRRDKVTAATPKLLPVMPDDFPKNRLGFAEWLLLPDQPLTARVTVNRFWQELFGTGIVRTTGDFGVSGELPINQELLDWMAVDFREHDWDMKRFFKMLVMSAAYRQSAETTPEKLAHDPDNRLLSRGPRFRMDAEMVRDYALAASGLLSQKIGGPSVRPYQPEGVWEMVAMPESNTRNYKRDEGEKLYRRSMYTFWKRAAPPATMEIFNAPSRETCAVRRERTNTPLQALVTMNDPQFIEAARCLAERSLKEAGESEQDRLNFIARRLLARPLHDQEKEVVLGVLQDLQSHYDAAPEEARKLIEVGASKPDSKLQPATVAAYTMVVNELMNLDEVLNK